MKKYFLIIPLFILMTGIAYIAGTGSNNIKDIDQSTIKNTSVITKEVTKPEDDDCCKVVKSTSSIIQKCHSIYQTENGLIRTGRRLILANSKIKR